ncbi:hypothetical protein PTKIN_Ptkin08bG0101600 [Pterospermum kingtungense]
MCWPCYHPHGPARLRMRFYGSAGGDPAWLFTYSTPNQGCNWRTNSTTSFVDWAKTIKEEKEISENMAKHQETVAESSMVELSHLVSEMLRKGDVEGVRVEKERVESAVESKKVGLKEML